MPPLRVRGGGFGNSAFPSDVRMSAPSHFHSAVNASHLHAGVKAYNRGHASPSAMRIAGFPSGTRIPICGARRRTVVRAFPSDIRISALSFLHHQTVRVVKDPTKRQGWLQWAAEKASYCRPLIIRWPRHRIPPVCHQWHMIHQPR